MASHATGMLSMQDVADLAGVSRQAVTNWRRRPRTAHGRVNPFPSPALSRKGSDYFDQEAIVTWLEETGRGKNREASFDAPALVPPEGADMELLVMLLCLRAGSFDDLHALDAHDLAELAHTTDPDDAFLNAEMSAAIARSGLHEALEYIDALFDASTGAEDALRRITTGRLAREAAKRRYSPDYLTVIRAVLEGIGEARGPLSVVVDDADLLPAVAVGTLAFDRTAQSASGLLSVREVLRRAYIVRMSAHEWDSTSFTADSLDSFTTENHSRTALRLVSLHGLPPEGALDVLD